MMSLPALLRESWRSDLLCTGVLVLLATTLPVRALEVSIAEDGMLEVDGARMFGVGLYENPKDDAVLKAVAEAGFNLVRSGGDREALDRLHAQGLYAWVKTGGRINLGPNGDKPDDELRAMADSLADHPALLIWEVPDEALWGCWLRAWRGKGNLAEKHAAFRQRAAEQGAGIEAGHKRLREIDPHHPLWMNHAPCNSLEQLTAFSVGADIVGCDIYPVLDFPQTPWDFSGYLLGAVGHFTHRMSLCAPGKPIWMVLQGFGYDDLGDGPLLVTTRGSRRPTPKEVRFMTYDAIVRGARAVLYWGTHNIEKDSQLWQGIMTTVRELAGLQHVLSMPDADVRPQVDARLLLLPFEDAVQALGKNVDGHTWWLVVNEYPLPLNYTLRGLDMLNGKTFQDAKNELEVTVKNGRLSLPIAAYGVQILAPAT